MRIRRMAALCLGIFFLMSLAAFAETTGDVRCWTANDDAAYHLERACTGQEMFPISERAALAFGKMACDKCVSAEEPEIIYDDTEIWMASRAGTYILCIPVVSMESTEALPETEDPETVAFTGDAVEKKLRGMLSESAYGDIENRLEADGWVYDSCRVPELMLGEDVLFMSARLIGENWYFVVRPEKSYGAETRLNWRVVEWDFQLESYGTLTLARRGGDERTNTLSIADHSGAEVLFEMDYGNVEITVYRRQGMNTAVLRDKRSHKGGLTGTLIVGESDTGVVLNGYLDSKGKAVYCCVLSDGELGSLVAGKMPQIKYE